MRFRPELLALILVVAFLAFMITISHRDDASVDQSEPGSVVRSSYYTFPEGYKGLFLTLQQLGYDARRQIYPYTQLPPRGLLIVVDPYKQPVGEYELRCLTDWIGKGNHALVMLEYHGEGFLEIDKHYKVPKAFLPIIDSPTGFSKEAWDIVSGKKQDDARALMPSFLSNRAPVLTVKTGCRFDDKHDLAHTLPVNKQGSAWLYQDSQGPVVAYTAIGKGGIVWCTSPWSFSNEGIKAGHNFDFFLALANLQPGTPILFDEYHHNYGANTSIWSVTPAFTRLGILQFCVALALLLITLAWRFGPQQLPVEERFSRSRAEYLTSMAGLLERLHATHVVVQRVRLRLSRVLGGRLGVPANVPLKTLVEANIQHPMVNHKLLVATCRELLILENEQHPDEDAMLEAAQDVERLVSLKVKKK